MYIVIELQKNRDGQVANIVTSYNNLVEAESKFHTIMAAAAINEVPVHSAIILFEDGAPVRYDCYKH